MPLLNYTTKIEATKTAGEIQGILAAHGARAIQMEYDAGTITALAFIVDSPHGDIVFRLPIDPDAVYRVMLRQSIPRRFMDNKQAVRVAWRIIKDWVQAQMALLETEQVRLEQIFLPYAIMQSGKTLYETMIDTRFQLPGGRE